MSEEDRIGRVVSERRGEWTVLLDGAEVHAKIAGRLRNEIDEGQEMRPAIGDRVVLREEGAGEALRLIERVLPRTSAIARKSAGRAADEQVVAANVDTVFVVCALGRDVNERRIERFVTISWDGGASPVVLLNKADLFDEDAIAGYVERVQQVTPGVPVHVISAINGAGLGAIEPLLAAGRTIALLGSSGAGKSTLLNRWLGESALATAETGPDGKGRHTTTHRELRTLPSGAAVIDTPGLREVGLWSGDEGLARAFEDITEVAARCRFGDCGHETEPGCAVAAAVEDGTLDAARVESWHRLRREQAFVESRSDAKAALERKAAGRRLSKLVRAYSKDKGRK